jgi:hypothetical protein
MKTTTTGLSLPIDLFLRIESERGDVGRSKYILRLLEKALDENTVQLRINREVRDLESPPPRSLRQETHDHTQEAQSKETQV